MEISSSTALILNASAQPSRSGPGRERTQPGQAAEVDQNDTFLVQGGRPLGGISNKAYDTGKF